MLYGCLFWMMKRLIFLILVGYKAASTLLILYQVLILEF